MRKTTWTVVSPFSVRVRVELSNMGDAGPISLQISTEFLTHLDHTMLDAPTMSIKGLSLLNLGMRISKIGSQIGLQRGLVAFDNKKEDRRALNAGGARR